jgi:hypothetical protein
MKHLRGTRSSTIEEEIASQGHTWTHGIGREVCHSRGTEHFFIDKEISCDGAAIALEDMCGRFRDDVGCATVISIGARYHLQGRSGDDGPRPQGVDCNSKRPELFRHSNDTHTHAIFCDGVGHVGSEPFGAHVEGRREREDVRIRRPH